MINFSQSPKQKFDYVQERIQQVCDRSNRKVTDVTLIGVSKGHTFEHIKPYLDLNIQHFGENYLQEAEGKLPLLLQSKSSLKTHFIGHLQTNKAKKVLELFDYIHSVDSIKLAQELDKRCNQLFIETKKMKYNQFPIFVEVNLSGDENKTGCKLEDLHSILEFTADTTTKLSVLGLMVISPLKMVNKEELHQFFRKAKKISDEIQENFPSSDKLSMGMSDDFEIAIEEGSTHIRIGTLLFGSRI